MSICDMAIEILGKTNDGNDLCPRQLLLVEHAVNGLLSNEGCEAFDTLYHSIVSGGYSRPFLHGIEHLTINLQARVYWKDKQIEHYDYSYAFSKEGKKAATELANRCRHLEKIGIEVNVRNVIWLWSKYENRRKHSKV